MSDLLVCPQCHRSYPAFELGSRCSEDSMALVPNAMLEMYPKDVMLGRVIAGKYPVVGVIGAGGMGRVYHAIQQPVGRDVAIKVIKGTEVTEESWRKRFFREARVVAKLTHPATVTLHDYGQEKDGILYMVLEYIRGVSLGEVIRSIERLAPARAVAIACQALGALGEAHSMGLVHRDLKPDNIMLVQGTWGEEQVKVLDFGIAKVRRRAQIGDDSLETEKNVVLGSPRYMAPEQAWRRGVGAQTDLYSMGIVLYEMLTGQPPFMATNPMVVFQAHERTPVPGMPPEIGVPQPLEQAVRKALAKVPKQRYPDALTMAEALRAALPGSERAASISQAGVSHPDLEAHDAPTISSDSLALDLPQARDEGKPEWKEDPERSPHSRSKSQPFRPPSFAGSAATQSDAEEGEDFAMYGLRGWKTGIWIAVAAGVLITSAWLLSHRSAESPGEPSRDEIVLKALHPAAQDPYDKAASMAREGDPAKAVKALQEALESAKDPKWLLKLTREDPDFEGILQHPDMKSLMRSYEAEQDTKRGKHGKRSRKKRKAKRGANARKTVK